MAEKKEKTVKAKVKDNSGSGAIYALGIFGAAYYFLSHAISFWDGVLGLLKALVWPAILVWKVFDLLKM